LVPLYIESAANLSDGVSKVPLSRAATEHFVKLINMAHAGYIDAYTGRSSTSN
jgi:hypothetical protein